MNFRRMYAGVSILLLVVLVVSGCGPTPAPPAPTAAPAQPTSPPAAAQPTAVPVQPTAPPPPTPVPTAKEPVTLVVVDGNEKAGLYPPTSTGPPGHLDYLLFDPLVGHDETMSPDPDKGLATSWEIGEDQLTWTFHLREGIKFHDGTPFEANAVKVTIESIQDPDTGANRRSVYTVIKEVNVVDPLTVQMVTESPFPDLPFLLMDRSAFIVSPTALEKLGVADFGRQPVGTGPFKFVEWVPNDHVTFEANPDYWRGAPAVDVVIYRPVPEAAVRTAMLKTGEADIAANISPEDLESLKADPNLVVLQEDSLTQVTSEMRQTQPPFSIKEVRKAMNYAIDKESIVKDIMRGVGRIADSPGPPGVWGSVELEPYTYDPEKAKQLLADAGYPNGFEGNLFFVPGRWAGDEQVTVALQAYWQAVGVKIELMKLDQAGLTEWLRKHPDEMAGWTTQQIRTSSYLDYHLYRLFNTEAAIMEGSQRSGYSNPKVDELLAKGRAAFDLEERAPYYAEAQELIWDDAPFIWVFVQQNLMAAQKNVSGYVFLPTGNLELYGVTK